MAGGGRIRCEGDRIFVYGFSYSFGKADHARVVELIKTQRPGATVSWSDDGY